jgi:uncharacterized cofD-like protein
MEHIKHTKEKDTPHIVTIGGGTGHAAILSGLKEHPVKLTAIVSMADDGGSGGALRDELGVLPPGDVRMCLVALSSAPNALRELFQYRFEDGGMSGHTLGNMFLSALEKTTGSFPTAVATAGRILQVYGRVVPVSEDDMRLLVTLKDGTVLRGERYLNDNETVRGKGVKSVALEKEASASKSAIEAILQADIIVLGPGGLYDSLLPNLLVRGIAEAICKSPATVLYVANLTNKKGQTDGFSVHDYADALLKCLGAPRIDAVLVNNALPKPELLKRYEAQEGKGTLVTCPKRDDVSYDILTADVLSEDIPAVNAADRIAKSRSLIRHDSQKLARKILSYLKKLHARH